MLSLKFRDHPKTKVLDFWEAEILKPEEKEKVHERL
jgi:hypothetical protein